MRRIVLSAAGAVALAGTAMAAPLSSADGDVRVTSAKAKIYDRSYAFVTVSCAKTGTDVGCPAGRVVLLMNDGKSVSTKGEFPALANGASTWARIKVGTSLLSSFSESTASVTVTARAVRSGGESGLETKLRLTLPQPRT